MPFTIGSGMPQGSSEEGEDSAFKIGNPQIFNLPAPASYTGNATQTLLATDLLGGIIVIAGAGGTGAVTLTTPTAALLAAALRAFSSRGVVVGDTIWCLIINGNNAAAAITLAAGTGGSFDANQPAATRVIAQNSSKEIAIRFTNGTPGSEAYVVYS